MRTLEATLELKLEPRERELLTDILESHLGDLRMEIGKTENFEMRNDLKADEQVLKGLIARVKTPAQPSDVIVT
jgi:predicted phosphatase